MPDPKKLIAVFTEARELLDRPGNDFAWSYWDDREMAVAEIDGILSGLRSGTSPGDLTLQVIFAPTGPLQEVSLSSGWGDAFLKLADAFDEAMAGEYVSGSEGRDEGLQREMTEEPCVCCIAPSHNLTHVRDLGMDSRFAEVSLLQCPDCGRQWLRYYYEAEAFTGSGRWYLGMISPMQSAPLDAERAREIFEKLDWYYYGGSYYDGKIGRISGAIVL